MPSDAHENLAAMLAAGRASPERSIEETRAGWDLMDGVLPRAEGVRFEPADAGGVPGSWLVPEGATSRTILHLHGGGYVIGSSRSHGAFASHLAAATSARVLLLGYSLAPEHPAPAALDDTIRSYRWLLREIAGADEIVMSGDSAGGGLALAALAELRDQGLPLPRAALLLSPWLDLTLSGASMRARAEEDIVLSPELLEHWGSLYRGDLPADDPRLSPLLGGLDGLPPLLVQVGTREILLDDARRLAERTSDGSVEVTLRVHEDMIHVWPVLGAGVIPEAQGALDEAAAYLADLDGWPP
jgi:epsilon-lactone hydrolase